MYGQSSTPARPHWDCWACCAGNRGVWWVTGIVKAKDDELEQVLHLL